MFVLYKMDVLLLVKMITKMIENNVLLYLQITKMSYSM